MKETWIAVTAVGRDRPGIVAGVIPVLLLALYVETASQWSSVRTKIETDKMELAKLTNDVVAELA